MNVQWETTIKGGLPVIAVAEMFNIGDRYAPEWEAQDVHLFWRSGKQKELPESVYKTIQSPDWDRLWEEAKEHI